MNRTDVRVAISGFGGLDNPEPGTATARALRNGWKGRLEIDALCYSQWDTGAWVPGLTDRLHLATPIADGDEAVLQRLLSIHEDRPLDAIVPTLDLEIPVFARLAHRLEREGIQTLLPSPEDVAAVSKGMLTTFCFEHGFRAPRTIYVSNPVDVPLYASQLGYPLYVKSTVAGAKKVSDAHEAVFEATAIQRKWGGGILLQEPVEGDEYVVSVVLRSDESCLSLVSVRKLGINQRGKSVVGTIVNDPKLKAVSLQIIKKLHWRGPLELEFVRAKTGELFLIEINHRFPSWIGLNAFAQPNLPVLLLREILKPGQRANGTVMAGHGYVRDIQEFAVPGEQMRRLLRFGEATPPKTPKKARSLGDITVGVTGISAFELTQPGLGAARSLRRSPEIGEIYGLAYGAYDTGLQRTDCFDGGFGLPDWSEPERVLDRIRVLQSRIGMNVLIPCLDFEISYFLDLQEELASLGIHMLLPSRRALTKVRKANLPNLLSTMPGIGFDAVPTKKIRSKKDLGSAWDRFGSPLVLKGETSGIAVAFTKDQALEQWQAAREADATLSLAQPMVRGEEYGVSAVYNKSHKPVDQLAVKKLAMTEKGKTWGAIAVECAELIQGLDAYFEEIRWTGPADVEFIRDAVTDQYTIIEINPRLPAWSAYTSMLGGNAALQVVKAALGPSTTSQRHAEDLMFMRTTEDIPANVQHFALFASQNELRHV